MLTGLWTPKGGSGTTVTACALARLHDPALIIDTAGDVPAVLGLAESDTPGIRDWLASDSPDSRLDDLVEVIDERLSIIRSGSAAGPFGDRSWSRLADWASRRPGEVIVDLGTGRPDAWTDISARSVMVVRPCYLALRRSVRTATTPDGIIVISEPGRALSADDVARCLGAPVLSAITVDPTVARAVDAGLLLSRLPASLGALASALPT